MGAGRFQLIRLLGRGGMGEVWLAEDAVLNQRVALKFVADAVATDASALGELRHETQRAVRLSHPNILRVHDLHIAEDAAFLTMAHVDGDTLAARLAEQPGGRFTWAELRPLVRQICDALEYAHAEGVVHRDLKPGNVLIDERGRVKLADFGVSAELGRALLLTTRTSGTPAYMSPEQVQGGRPSVRDDIYGLGALLYELLSGKPPFHEGDVSYQVLHEAPESLERRLNRIGAGSVPGAVSSTVMACLAKRPELRPESVAAVRAAWGEPAAAELPRTQFGEPLRERIWTRPVKLTAMAGFLMACGVVGGAWWKDQRAVPVMDPAKAPVARDAAGGQSPDSIAKAEELIGRMSSHFLSPAEVEPGFQPMFNGRDLSGWCGDGNHWRMIPGGCVVGDYCGERLIPNRGNFTWNRRWLKWTNGSVGNFELRFDMLEAGSPNSGVLIRGGIDQGQLSGYEMEICGSTTGSFLRHIRNRQEGDLSPQGYPSLPVAAVGNDTRLSLGDGAWTVQNVATFPFAGNVVRRFQIWNWVSVRLVVEGRRMESYIDGQALAASADLTPRALLEPGQLALELATPPGQQRGAIFFRNVRIKHLPPGEPGP